MKGYITGLLMAAMLTVAIPAMATTSFAQTRNYYRSERRQYNDSRYQNNRSYDQNTYYDGYKQPNVYDRHHKAMNMAIATGAGAIIGALIGGKKGALIGAGAGVVTGAIVTKKQKSRNYSYRY